MTPEQQFELWQRAISSVFVAAMVAVAAWVLVSLFGPEPHAVSEQVRGPIVVDKVDPFSD